MIAARIVEDSVAAETGKRITTLSLIYPRFIHSELMTHRVFSRNAASSRAIPVKKMLDDIRNNPAMPVYWGKNQKGMEAEVEMDVTERKMATDLWLQARDLMLVYAEKLADIGLHKQITNRILEPWQHMSTVLTSTEWDNAKNLRIHRKAQPEFKALMTDIRDVMGVSKPMERWMGEWHLPYITPEERACLRIDELTKYSVARCCRVSLKNHEGEIDRDKDMIRFWDLMESGHMSPFEHPATPAASANFRSGNFLGWIQYRKLIPGEAVFSEEAEAVNARKAFKVEEALRRTIGSVP